MSAERKKRSFFPKKHIQEQLLAFESAQVDLAYEQAVALSAGNRSHVKSIQRKLLLALLLLILISLCVWYFFQPQETTLLVCLLILVALSSLLLKAVAKIQAVLQANKKTVIRGVITDRFTRKEYSKERDDDGKRSARVNQYLVIGKREFRVNNEIYATYRTGQAVEVHFIDSPKKSRHYFLEHHLLKEAGLQ